MTRATLIFVLMALVLAGFEGAADAAGSFTGESQDQSHEMHGSVHGENHEHDSEHDDHFCHCSLHAMALLSTAVKPILQKGWLTLGSYDSRFSSQAPIPLLRPPNS